MRNKLIFWLLLTIILLFSCQSIKSNRAELDIPHSIVYFSFDDGPDAHGNTTDRLLDILKKYQITALFCLLGENAEQYPDLVKRIHGEGHYLANHGYSDQWAIKMNDDEFRNNLKRGEAAIANALGYNELPYRLYRPHGGFYNKKQEQICIDEGYTIIPVTVRVYDAIYNVSDRKKVIRKTVNIVKMKNGGLILLHDGRDSHPRREIMLEKNPNSPYNRSWIPETVEEIIIALLDSGFNLNVKMPLFN